MEEELVCPDCKGVGAVLVRQRATRGIYHFETRARLCSCTQEKIKQLEKAVEEKTQEVKRRGDS